MGRTSNYLHRHLQEPFSSAWMDGDGDLDADGNQKGIHCHLSKASLVITVSPMVWSAGLLKRVSCSFCCCSTLSVGAILFPEPVQPLSEARLSNLCQVD